MSKQFPKNSDFRTVYFALKPLHLGVGLFFLQFVTRKLN